MSLVLFIVIGVIIAIAAASWYVWPRLVFSPVYYDKRDAFHLHPERFRPLQLVRDQNVVLEGIVYTPENPVCTVLYFGGKEQDSVALVGKLSDWFPGWQIVSFNYRGYGLSQGRPTEKALLNDAVFIAEYVKERYGEIVLMGYSLGSSVAAFTASRTETKGLVLVSPFYDVPSLAKARLMVVPQFLFRCRFETARYLGGVKQPVYMFAGTGDTVVPISHVRRLREKAVRLALYKEYSGYNHAEILGSKAFVADALEICR